MPKLEVVQEVQASSPDGRVHTVTEKVFRTVLKPLGWQLEGTTEVRLDDGTPPPKDQKVQMHETGDTMAPLPEHDPFEDNPDPTMTEEVDEEFAALRSKPKPPPVRKGKKSSDQ